MKINTLLIILLAAAFTTGCHKEQPATERIPKIKTETNDALPEFKEYTIAQHTDSTNNIPAGLAVIDDRPSQIVSEESFSQTPTLPIPQSVTLTWDASTSPNLKCYRIHFGTNGANYAFVTNVGLVLTQTVILPHRDRWLFAMTAVDMNGVESAFGNQTGSGDESITPVERNKTEVRNQIKP